MTEQAATGIAPARRGESPRMNFVEAARFLARLDEDAETFQFWALPESGDTGDLRPSYRTGAIEDAAIQDWMQQSQSLGCGIFVTVNAFPAGAPRRLEFLDRIRAVWIEDDWGNIPPLPLDPSLIVETSPGKRHLYYLVDGLDQADHRGVMERLVRDYRSDPNVKDAARVLRLPGSVHLKDPQNPSMVRVVQDNAALPYSAAAIIDAFPPIPVSPLRAGFDPVDLADLPDPVDLDPQTLDAARAIVVEEAAKTCTDPLLGRHGQILQAGLILGNQIPWFGMPLARELLNLFAANMRQTDAAGRVKPMAPDELKTLLDGYRTGYARRIARDQEIMAAFAGLTSFDANNNAPAGDPGPAGVSPAHGSAAQAPTIDTEAAVRKSIDAITPGSVVTPILQRMAMLDGLRESESTARIFCDDIAARARVSRTVVWSEYRKHVRTVKTAIARAAKDAKAQARLNGNADTQSAKTKGGDVSHALSVLAQPIKAIDEIESLLDFFPRYVWVIELGAFWDMAAHQIVPRQTLDGTFQRLGFALAPDEGLGSSDDDAAAPKAPPKASDALLNSFDCVRCDLLDYAPQQAIIYKAEDKRITLNSWKDDGIKPIEGDVDPWLELIHWLIPDDNERNHLIRWMAYCYLNQGKKINHNPLIGGTPRIGKDSIIEPLKRGLGESNVSGIDDPGKLAEPYEDAFVDTKLVCINELMDTGHAQLAIENKLKKFGAAPPTVLTLRRFGQRAVRRRNIVQIYATTNYQDAARLETSRERWHCVWCVPSEPRPGAFYKSFYAWLDSGGAEAVLYYLAHDVDLTGFEPSSEAPHTTWSQQIQAMNQENDFVADRIRELIQYGEGVFAHDVVKLQDVIDAVRTSYVGDPDLRDMTRRRIIRAFRRAGAISSGPASDSYGLVRMWAIRNLDFWREGQKGAVWRAYYESQGAFR